MIFKPIFALQLLLVTSLATETSGVANQGGTSDLIAASANYLNGMQKTQVKID